MLLVGSPRLIVKALRRPGTVHPWVLAAACLPRGRAEHKALRGLVNGLVACGRQPTAPWPSGVSTAGGSSGPGERPVGTDGRAARAQTWVTAVDYDSGRRVAFGRTGDPQASLADAVVASCSVPGWYRPTVIGGHPYIDGGVRSGANADLPIGANLNEVYVAAPAASLVVDSPPASGEQVERLIRRVMTGALLREIAQLRRCGTRVTVLTPGPDDLAVIGGNLMDHRRRGQVFETSLATCAAALARDSSLAWGAA